MDSGEKITILLDNGHGCNTPGKLSPDGLFREYKWCREVVDIIYNKLKSLGYNAVKLVTEVSDVSLKERCKRANSYDNAILISIHNNAAGADGEWHSANGWSVWTYTKCSLKSKNLANCLIKYGKAYKGNRALISNSANFYILKNAKCPAILTENMFQDNKDDVQFLMSEKGKQAIADIHVNGIIDYIKLNG